MTGATSQGKSTTLAAMIDEINHTRSAHIITVEDPIEYTYPVDRAIIDQREVVIDTLNFNNALRASFAAKSRCDYGGRNERFRNNFHNNYCG